MHYITSDIHNDNEKFQKLIQRLDLTEKDKLYILGDLFDRSNYNPDPVGVYFMVLQLGDKCQVIRGNHEQDLSEYIISYFNTKERKRKDLSAYAYNSFGLLGQKLTPIDMQNMAKWILSLPVQIEVEVEGQKYLLAHVMTSSIEIPQVDEYFVRGEGNIEEFLKNGVDGYISICGHSNPEGNTIWKNETGNVFICDCGCGFKSGRLGCICLETGEAIYA